MNTKRTKSTTPPAKIAEDNTKQGEKIKRFVRLATMGEDPDYGCWRHGSVGQESRTPAILLAGPQGSYPTAEP